MGIFCTCKVVRLIQFRKFSEVILCFCLYDQFNSTCILLFGMLRILDCSSHLRGSTHTFSHGCMCWANWWFFQVKRVDIWLTFLPDSIIVICTVPKGVYDWSLTSFGGLDENICYSTSDNSYSRLSVMILNSLSKFSGMSSVLRPSLVIKLLPSPARMLFWHSHPHLQFPHPLIQAMCTNEDGHRVEFSNNTIFYFYWKLNR